jgi:hypothetical protein
LYCSGYPLRGAANGTKESVPGFTPGTLKTEGESSSFSAAWRSFPGGTDVLPEVSDPWLCAPTSRWVRLLSDGHNNSVMNSPNIKHSRVFVNSSRRNINMPINVIYNPPFFMTGVPQRSDI